MPTDSQKLPLPKKKRPRTCVACGEESPKRALMRVVRTPEGKVEFDSTGKANGRGAYVCARLECVRAAKKKKAAVKTAKKKTAAPKKKTAAKKTKAKAGAKKGAKKAAKKTSKK